MKQKITINEIKRLSKLINQTEAYKPITLVRKITAYGLIGIGVITLPLPTGSIFAIIGGCALLGIDPKKLMRIIKFNGKKLFDWVYGNRSWKLIKRTIRMRFM